MPRPMRPLPLMVAAMAPEGIYHCARRGFNVQTTPLQASHDVLLQQVEAFHRGKAEAGAKGHDLRLSLQRPAYLARDAADARDRKRVVSGKSVSVRVDLGGRRLIKKKK